jgi:hypothetical protein
VIDRLHKIIDTLGFVKIDNCNNNQNFLADNLKPLEPVDLLKRLKNLVADLIIHVEMLGTFGGYKACIAHMIQVETYKKTLSG